MGKRGRPAKQQVTNQPNSKKQMLDENVKVTKTIDSPPGADATPTRRTGRLRKPTHKMLGLMKTESEEDDGEKTPAKNEKTTPAKNTEKITPVKNVEKTSVKNTNLTDNGGGTSLRRGRAAPAVKTDHDTDRQGASGHQVVNRSATSKHTKATLDKNDDNSHEEAENLASRGGGGEKRKRGPTVAAQRHSGDGASDGKQTTWRLKDEHVSLSGSNSSSTPKKPSKLDSKGPSNDVVLTTEDLADAEQATETDDASHGMTEDRKPGTRKATPAGVMVPGVTEAGGEGAREAVCIEASGDRGPEDPGGGGIAAVTPQSLCLLTLLRQLTPPGDDDTATLGGCVCLVPARLASLLSPALAAALCRDTGVSTLTLPAPGGTTTELLLCGDLDAVSRAREWLQERQGRLGDRVASETSAKPAGTKEVTIKCAQQRDTSPTESAQQQNNGAEKEAPNISPAKNPTASVTKVVRRHRNKDISILRITEGSADQSESANQNAASESVNQNAARETANQKATTDEVLPTAEEHAQNPLVLSSTSTVSGSQVPAAAEAVSTVTKVEAEEPVEEELSMDQFYTMEQQPSDSDDDDPVELEGDFEVLEEDPEDDDPDDEDEIQGGGDDVKVKTEPQTGAGSKPVSTVRCLVCDHSGTVSAITQHYYRVHSGTTFLCPFSSRDRHCPFKAATKRQLAAHIASLHGRHVNQPNILVAMETNSAVERQTTLHVGGLRGGEPACLLCDRAVSSLQELTAHERETHLSPQYTCQPCGSAFHRLSSLLLHAIVSHDRVSVPLKSGERLNKQVPPDMAAAFQQTPQSSQVSDKKMCELCGKMFGARGIPKHYAHCVKASKAKAGAMQQAGITEDQVSAFPERMKHQYQCQVCHFVSTKAGESHHRRLLHQSARLFQCLGCATLSPRLAHMRSHAATCSKQVKMRKMMKKRFPIFPGQVQNESSEDSSSITRYQLLYDTISGFEAAEPQQCQHCEFSGRPVEVYVHQKNVHRPFRLSCRLCLRQFVSDTALEKHTTTHFDPTAGGDRLVFRASESSRKWRLQRSKNLPEFIDCPICHKRVKRASFPGHRKSHQKTHVCPECGVPFRFMSELSRHLVKRHTPAALQCAMCENAFVDEAALQQHLQDVHAGQCFSECDVCGKRFMKARYMKEHRKRQHENPHRFSCHECGKLFYERNKLQIHMASHLPESAASAGPYRAQCHVCFKRFKTPAYLSKHLNLHTGETVFECSICSKRFNLLTTLKKHQLTHTNQKPYVCSFPGCSKAFKTRTKLKYHTIIHTQESPHVCTVCDKVFTQAYTLRKHVCKYETAAGVTEVTATQQLSANMAAAGHMTMQLERHVTDAAAWYEINQSQPSSGSPQAAAAAAAYMCSVCSVSLSSLDEALRHVQTQHATEQPAEDEVDGGQEATSEEVIVNMDEAEASLGDEGSSSSFVIKAEDAVISLDGENVVLVQTDADDGGEATQ